MKNSFLIKNHGPSNFDQYFQMMKKRRMNVSHTQSVDKSVASPSPMLKKANGDLLYGKIKGRRPAARDGHTGVVYNHQLIIFGGDRHQMPHSDTFIFDLRTELEAQGVI